MGEIQEMTALFERYHSTCKNRKIWTKWHEMSSGNERNYHYYPHGYLFIYIFKINDKKNLITNKNDLFFHSNIILVWELLFAGEMTWLIDWFIFFDKLTFNG